MMPPFSSVTSPKAFTTDSAPTTRSPERTDHEPSPPFIAAFGPTALPTVAPVPAPTEPSGTMVDAAPQACMPISGVGRASKTPSGSRSKITAAGTMGITPGPTAKPRFRDSSQRMTPSAAASPYADPPHKVIASTRPASASGRQASSSREPVARPFTNTVQGMPPCGARTTVQPVAPRSSVA